MRSGVAMAAALSGAILDRNGRSWHGQTSRSRPDMSVHWGEAVKVTPRSK